MRVYDIRNAYQPVEVGACVPAAPKKLMDPRPNRPVVLHSADVFVDKNGLCVLHRLERRRFVHHGIHGLSMKRSTTNSMPVQCTPVGKALEEVSASFDRF